MKKNIMFQALSIAFLIVSVCLSSCQWHTIEPINTVIDPDTADPVSFSTEVQPIFDDNCNACHNNTNPKLTSDVAYSNLISGDYVNTTTPEESVILTKIKDGHNGIIYTIAQETLILTWISQGAENN